ncbi:hypothetical protein VTL71DRAFT_4976 [Oculimacula yallundae]|uniref:NACHT domain-containing protein n=1 Tax=Oculimacula yallundae TaxID=86028 RepID=A0ABR4C439_9HELO
MDSDDSQDFVLVTGDDIDDNEDSLLPQPPDVLDRIQKWLEPTDYDSESSEYQKHLNSYLPGTGEWVRETEEYQQWHNSPSNRSLWLKATAGAGKSVLAAMLADKLAKVEKFPVLCFFFRQIIATNHDPQSMVRDWISMTLSHSPLLQATMKKYMDDRRSLDTISANELWQHLLKSLTALPKVYCVVDALDEMDIDKQYFIANLVDLGQQESGSIKLLVTSRPLPRIEAFLRTSSVLQIRLDQLKVDPDIAVYVDNRLQLASADGSLKESVKEAIGDKAQGSFLYARLIMDELLDHLKQMVSDIKYIERSLSWLPLTLEDMYNGMLHDHCLRSRVPQDHQRTILQWVTHSSRPLRLLELATIVDMQNEDGSKNQDSKAIARAACGPLLEILEDETVSVIHHSFTEFLTDSTRGSRPAVVGAYPQFPVIDPEAAHRTMALICLKYLNSGCLDDWTTHERKAEDDFYRPKKGTQRSIKMKYPFLDYAMNNFYVHVSKTTMDETLQNCLDAFMSSENSAFSKWVDMTWINTFHLVKVSPLHVAAWAGMNEYTQHLLRSGYENNNTDGQGRTPLSWATARGHTEVVASLLEHVKDPDVDDDQGLKPLHYATQGNHHQIVKLLVSSGVSPLTVKTKDPNRRCGNTQSTVGQSPLRYASEAGSIESLREMVPHLAPKDLNQALCWASQFGKAETVDFLLNLPGVSANPPDQLDTPLFLAVSGLYHEVARALLEKGAGPDRVSENGRHLRAYSLQDLLEMGRSGPTPLHAICAVSRYHRLSDEEEEKGARKCLHLLLKYGCNVNSIDREGKTPLHRSVAKPIFHTVSLLLLENGADPTISDKSGETPLHLMNLHDGSGPLLDLLIAQGANLTEGRSCDGYTPLHCMIHSLNESNAKQLLPHVSDWNVVDSNGNTPLHVLLAGQPASETGLKVLIEAGADLERRNKKGEAPIHCLGISNFTGDLERRTIMLSMLLAAGADLESKDHGGRTVLSRLLEQTPYSFKDNAQNLIDHGAKVDCIDHEGNSILHSICRKCPDAALIQSFVSKGVNPLSINHAGNNLLHELYWSEAVTENLMATVTLLLTLGVPPTAKNNYGETPLHLICSTAFLSTIWQVESVDFILGSPIGASIDHEDNRGIRPIHLAATISEQLVSKLINHGADVRSVTHEGLNLLHIAARARQSNIVGLVVDKLHANNGLDLLNGVDENGCTPLHYACRSGRPETVSILLNARADVGILDKNSRTPLHACAEFEEEKKLWSTSSSPTARACGILLNDKTRPEPNSTSHPWQKRSHSLWERVSPGHKTARIREIIRQLVQHGAVLAFGGLKSSPIDLAIQNGCHDMVDELLPLMEPIYAKAKEDNRKFGEPGTSRSYRFQEAYLVGYCRPNISADVIQNAIQHTGIQLCNNLLSLGKFSTMEDLPALGMDFYPNPGCDSDFLTTLVKCGYADLFQKLGDSITTPGWINGNREGNQHSGASDNSYLIAAAESELPNLDIIKIAIEHFGADVNIQSTTSDLDGFGPSPLHILSRGTQWWQSGAMEYLLSKGANTELKDEEGLSVLHYAVRKDHNYRVYRRKETVRILLNHGADPNSINEHGDTCLHSAMYDLELVNLLIRHGADATLGDQPVLFSAISSLDVEAVSVILKAGANCDARQGPIDGSNLRRNNSNRTPDTGSSPLHFISSSKFNTPDDCNTAMEIIKLLLEHGADPYLQLNEDSTLLHEIFKSGGIMQPFLDIPKINLEHRDQKGQTLLLAACQSRWGTRFPSNIPNAFGQKGTLEERTAVQRALYPGDPPAFLSVFRRGGDIAGVDAEGNGVFHFLTNLAPSGIEGFDSAIDEMIKDGMKIMDVQNNSGFTPLQIAFAKSNWLMVEKLSANGADLLAKDPDGNTALHHLVTTWSLQTETQVQWIERLINLGLFIDEKNKLGETPLFRSFAGGAKVVEENQEPFATLQKAGADIFTRNNLGETLLHVLAKSVSHGFRPSSLFGNPEHTAHGFRFLMKMGLDPMAEDKSHKTALDVAAACGNEVVLDIFKRDKAPMTDLPVPDVIGKPFGWWLHQ